MAGMDYQQQHLVKMVNQIASNVPRREAVAEQVGQHLKQFWTPEMRQQLRDIAAHEPESLVPDVHAALQSL